MDVATIGFPMTELLGLRPKVTRGIVSASSGFRDAPNQFQIDAPFQPDNSGSPVIDVRGAVVGVAAAGVRRLENVNDAVKVDYLRPLLVMSGVDAPAAGSAADEKFDTIIERVAPSVVLVMTR